MKVLLLKKVENIVTKGEIAHLEQFLLLSHCFQKSPRALVTTSESINMWERVKDTSLIESAFSLSFCRISVYATVDTYDDFNPLADDI